MRCVVTGAAGFVGSSLCDRLLGDGHTVVGVDAFLDYYPRAIKLGNIEKARANDRFNFVEGDLLTLDLEELFAGADVIFHQAAQAGVRASWGGEFAIYAANNILATQRVLEAARTDAVRQGLKKLVFASSSSIYGATETFPTKEAYLPQPISPYGVSKLAAEHLMQLYFREFGVPTVSLRYFTVYGPRQRPDMAFNRFIRAALCGETLTVFGDGEQSRDFTYIDDALEANIRAAGCNKSGIVFNIGGGSQVTVNQVLEQIREFAGGKLQVKYIERQKGDPRHTSADTALAQEYLGYRPAVELKVGLRAEFDWLKETLCE